MSGCWLWTGACVDSGYGVIRYGKSLRAHRVSWQIHNGPIPEGMGVLHRCDVPCCVNPAHLFLGTDGDNVRDRDKKNRQARGERISSAKLTAAAVMEIFTSALPIRVMARRHSISRPVVKGIRTGKMWRSVTGATQ